MKRRGRPPAKKNQQNQITLTQFEGDHITEVNFIFRQIFEKVTQIILFFSLQISIGHLKRVVKIFHLLMQV